MSDHYLSCAGNQVVLKPMMNKVAPKLQAVNSFRRSLDRLNKKKRVKFDLATVSFQVNYDDPNEHYQIPLWKKHVYPKKSNVFLLLIQQMTIVQWLKAAFCLFCIFKFLIQVFHVYTFYKKNYIQSSVNYQLPEQIEFPAITICIPVIIPFGHRCANDLSDPSKSNASEPSIQCSSHLSLSALFNQSISEFGHQCKIKTHSLPLSSCANISPPIETFYQNRRCYTYLSEISVFKQLHSSAMGDIMPITSHQETYVSVVVQSNHLSASTSSQSILKPEFYVHQRDQIPVDLLKEPLSLALNQHYNLQYYFLRVLKMDNEFFECHNYSSQSYQSSSLWKRTSGQSDASLSLKQVISRQDCIDRCVSEQLRIHCKTCTSPQLPIRRDLLANYPDQICSPSKQECNDLMIEQIVNTCDQSCPNDCAMEEVEMDVDESTLDDTSETQVTLKRKIVPDQEVRQLPVMNIDTLLSRIGGLFAFWTMSIVLVWKVADIIAYCWELFLLYHS